MRLKPVLQYLSSTVIVEGFMLKQSTDLIKMSAVVCIFLLCVTLLVDIMCSSHHNALTASVFLFTVYVHVLQSVSSSVKTSGLGGAVSITFSCSGCLMHHIPFESSLKCDKNRSCGTSGFHCSRVYSCHLLQGAPVCSCN